MLAMQGWKRAISTLSVRRPQPHKIVGPALHSIIYVYTKTFLISVVIPFLLLQSHHVKASLTTAGDKP